MAKEQDDDTPQGTESAEESAERHIAKVRQRVKEPAESEPERDETDDDDSDDDGSDEPDDRADGEPTRREKRQNRFREMQDRAERAERAAEAAAAAQQRIMEQLVAQRQPQEPQEDVEARERDAFVQVQQDQIELSRRYNARIRELQEAGQAMSDDEQRRFAGINYDIERRKTKVLADQYTRLNAPPPVDPAHQQRQAEISILRAQHADVFANRAAALHVDYAFRRMTQAEGRPDSLATAQAAIEEARKVVLKKGAPTQATKSKYTGSSTGAGGPAREGGQHVVKMGPEAKRMADAAFPHIQDDKKRYEHWAKHQVAAGQRKKVTARPG